MKLDVVVRVKLAKPSEQQTAAGWRRGDSVKASGMLELPGKPAISAHSIIAVI